MKFSRQVLDECAVCGSTEIDQIQDADTDCGYHQDGYFCLRCGARAEVLVSVADRKPAAVTQPVLSEEAA